MKQLVYTLVIVIALEGCKKYPENNLWFTPPYRALYSVLSHGEIIEFKVNGKDSVWTNFGPGRTGIHGGWMINMEMYVVQFPVAFDTSYKPGYSYDYEYVLKNSVNFVNNYKDLYFLKYTWKVLKLTNSELLIERKFYNLTYKVRIKRIK